MSKKLKSLVSIVLVTSLAMLVFVGVASAEQESGSRYYIDLGEIDPELEGYNLSFAPPVGYKVSSIELGVEECHVFLAGPPVIEHYRDEEGHWYTRIAGSADWVSVVVEIICEDDYDIDYDIRSKRTINDYNDYYVKKSECVQCWLKNYASGSIFLRKNLSEECSAVLIYSIGGRLNSIEFINPACKFSKDVYLTINGQLATTKRKQVVDHIFSSIQISGPEIYIPYDPSLDKLAMDIASQSFENFKNHKTVYFQEYLAYVVESKQKGETPISVDKWVLNKIEEVVKKEAGEVPPEDWIRVFNSLTGTSIPLDAYEKVEARAREHPYIVVTAIVAICGVENYREYQSGEEVDLKEVYGVKMPYKIHLSSFDFDINELKMKKDVGLTRFLGKISKTWKGENRETKFECKYNYDHGKEGYEGKITSTWKLFSNAKFDLSFSDALGATSRFQYTDDFWDIDVGSDLEELKIESKYFTSPWTSTSKILPDESNVHTIPVDSATKILDFYIDCREGDLSLYLYKPDGMKIDPSIALNDTNIGYAKNGTYEYYTVQSPDTGNWIMEVRAINVPTNGANYNILTLGWEEGRSTPTPGFEAIFAIAGLLAAAYLLRRK